MSTSNPLPADPDAFLARQSPRLSVLVSPPHICVRITELLADPQSTARAIGEVIGQDPGLTARLLRLVNSPFYGFRARVDTVSRAVALVGQNAVHNLAVAVSVVRSFSDIPNELVNMDTFWRHGVYCGLIAKDCAARVGILHPERLFVAGLLHDLGSLVLYQGCPDASREALLVANGDEGVLYQAEIETFGFSHAELGGRLMTRWGLPGPLADAVACHHRPTAAQVAPMEAATLHVAEALANRSRVGAFTELGNGEAAIDGAAWEMLGVTHPNALGEDLIRQAGEHFLETVSLVCSRSRAAATPRAVGLRRSRR